MSGPYAECKYDSAAVWISFLKTHQIILVNAFALTAQLKQPDSSRKGYSAMFTTFVLWVYERKSSIISPRLLFQVFELQ
jgi:hypothetical protein